MTKRIVSGVFLLVALGALGLILASALTSGEQLIVRFLTAIIVAALGLYVISDLRLQADDSAVAAGTRTTVSAPRVTTSEQHPRHSTAAFMATVTKKKASSTADLDASSWDGLPSEPDQVEAEPTIELTGRSGPSTSKTDPGLEAAAGPSSAADDDVVEAYSAELDEAANWPFNVDAGDGLGAETESADDVDGLVAIFAKKTEQELSEREAALSMAGGGSGYATSTAPSSHESYAFASGDPDGGGATATLTTNGTGIGDFLHQGVPLNGGDHHPVEPTNGSTLLQTKATDEDEPKSTNEPNADGDEPNPVSDELTESSDAATNGDDRADPAPGQLVEPVDRVAAASYADEGIAPIIDLRTTPAAAVSDDIESAIRSGELEVISSLIDQGVLSTEGPISDRDVRTMVYVAFTSSELRKILLAGGTIDGDNANLDLGQVDVFAPTVERKALEAGTSPSDGETEDTSGLGQAL